MATPLFPERILEHAFAHWAALAAAFTYTVRGGNGACGCICHVGHNDGPPPIYCPGGTAMNERARPVAIKMDIGHNVDPVAIMTTSGHNDGHGHNVGLQAIADWLR